jgi:hypothetical protein
LFQISVKKNEDKINKNRLIPRLPASGIQPGASSNNRISLKSPPARLQRTGYIFPVL